MEEEKEVIKLEDSSKKTCHRPHHNMIIKEWRKKNSGLDEEWKRLKIKDKCSEE